MENRRRSALSDEKEDGPDDGEPAAASDAETDGALAPERDAEDSDELAEPERGDASRVANGDTGSAPPKAKKKRRHGRFFSVVKSIAVALALTFFIALIVVLWAFRTGRAVEFVRGEVLARLREACGVDAEFGRLEIGVFPPELHLSKLVVTQPGAEELLSMDAAIVRLAVVPLFYGRLQIEELAMLEPHATIAIAGGRMVNLPACVQPSGESGTASPLALGIDDLRIERGRFRLVLADQLEAELADIGITLVPGESGGADLAVGVDGGRISARGQSVVVERFRLAAHIAGRLTAPRAVSVGLLEVGLDGVSLEGKGAIDLLGPVVEGEVRASAALDAVSRLWPGLPAMSGSAAVRASLSGLIHDPRAVGTVTVEKVLVEGYSAGDEAQVDFEVDRTGARVKSLAVNLGEGKVTGHAKVAFDEKMSIGVEVDVERLPFARLLECLQIEGPWVDYRANGHIAAEGQVVDFGLAGTLDVEVRDFFVFDGSYKAPENRRNGQIVADRVMLSLGPTQVRGRFSADPKGFSIDPATVFRGGTRGTAMARVNIEAADGIFVQADFPRFDFIDLGPIAGVQLNGYGTLAGRIEGPRTDIGGLGSFVLQDVAVTGIPFGDAQGSVTWQDTTILVDSIEGRLGKTSYEGDLRLMIDRGATLGITGTIPRGRVEDVLVPFGVDGREYGDPKGALTAKFDLVGPVRALTGPIDLELEGFEVVGEKAERGRIVGRMEAGAVIAEQAEFDKHGARLTASGYIDPSSGEVRAKVVTRKLRLQSIDTLAASTKALDGLLGVRLDLGGSIHGLTGTVSATLSEVKVGVLDIGGGKLNGKIRGASVDVKGELLGGPLAVEGTVELKSRLPYQASLRLAEYDVPKLVGAFSDHLLWSGSAAGRAKLSGSLVEWARSKGEVAIERGLFETPSLRLETGAAASFTLDDGIFETKRILVVGPTTRLQAAGKLGARLLDLAVQGRVDLGIVETAYPQVERCGGELTLDATVRGSAKEVDLVGSGRVEHGLLEWRGLPSRISNLSADLVFSQATVLIERADGRLDDGRIQGSGEVLLEGYRPSQIQLDLKVTGIRPRYLHPKFELSGVLSGDVDLEGKPDRLLLRGALDATRSLVKPKFEWRQMIGDPMQRLAPKVYDPTAEILHFDVGVHLAEPLRIKNDTADVLVTGDVRMTGTNQRIGLIGGLSVLSGRAGFLGREYQFEGGTIDLRDRLRFFPQYDLQLQARACAAQIRLNLVGTLDEVHTTYSSKPEMDETNIISCLIRGVRVKDLESATDEALGSFAGEALWRLSGVDRQVRKVLPVDQIDVTTEYSSRDRLYEPRVLIAKEILDGKVRLEYSSSLFNNEDQRLAIRYHITPHLTVQSGWTSSDDIVLGDLGLDVKYRWEW